MRSLLAFPVIAAFSCLLAACGGSAPPPPAADAAAPTPAAAPVALDKSAYPVFPNADAGADPAVPAEQGGKGFTGEGWDTNTDYDLIGDPRAVKGGTLRQFVMSFPSTLRMEGPESNSALNGMIGGMVYEGLLTIHPTTLKYMPVLATHWQISADRGTYRFRINPNARWSDGEPVTADDVVASWDLRMDKGLQDPTNELIYGKFERPVAESKYIVSVKSKVQNWRNFLYFATMSIYPAHVLKSVDGAKYLADYNFKLLPGTGPYRVDEADVQKGKSVTIRRRMDYWAADVRRSVGLNNFDEIRETVVRDQSLAFEQFKKGDLDTYYVNISREWIEELNFDKVKRGLIQKRKIFNDSPSGFSGIAFNTRKAPFSDIRVRKALTLLQDRDELIAKLFFNEYVPLNSYFAGGIYENPDNPKNKYDPQAALQLLAEAGWKDRDEQGRLVKNGQPLTLEVIYSDQSSERYLTVYQQALSKVGIGLNLRLVTPETDFKLMMERNFDMVNAAWTGLLFPNPESAFASSLADVPNNVNITGFKDPRVDELLKRYDVEYDPQKRASIIREIDGILANSYQYILAWDAPFSRIAYWDKFGHPEGYFTRIGDQSDIPSLWWIDPQKDAALRRARGDDGVNLPVGETEVRYWQDYDAREKAAATPQ
ncbi:MAG TPA: extracellular solute-binding protein [Gammaproteobacteria bacterium]|nr:extracellular solute-binding protein [Gammaproteobacteria bacterium]